MNKSYEAMSNLGNLTDYTKKKRHYEASSLTFDLACLRQFLSEYKSKEEVDKIIAELLKK